MTKSEPEKQNGYYLSVGSYDRKNYYKTYPPDSIVEDKKKEFSFSRKTNALGYPDDEWPLCENKSYTIACIGDSFTDGVGTSQDSSYVRQLKLLMLEEDSNVLTLNAGISGSDPFYGFVNYRDRIAIYKPKLVVQTLSSNDILDDYRVRGGMERFNTDRTISYAKKIPFETLYAVSYVARIFYHFAGYSYHNYSPIHEHEQQQIEKDIITLFEAYAEECIKNNCRLVVVLLPGLLEINTQKYRFNFDNIKNALQQNPHLVFQDLLPIYTQGILESNKKPEAYFWPLDGHHNTLGYKLMAKSIHQVILNQRDSIGQCIY